MKKNLIKLIIVQMMIFTAAYFTMTPDTLEDNTYVFGLLGSYDLVRGNSIWVMLGAMVLSVINIIVWWPKSPTRQTVKVDADTKSAETDKAKDPVVPKMD